jgi:hypothetical protein
MIPHHVYYQLVILVLLWLCIMLPHLWPIPPGESPKRPTPTIKPKPRRSREPKPFAGLTQKRPAACVSKSSDRVPKRHLHDGLIPCPQPTVVPGPSIPPCTFVPTVIVTIAAGSG